MTKDYLAKLSFQFTDSEMDVILEATRVSLADGCIFDALADELDLTDCELVNLREKIESVTNGIEVVL